MNYKISKARSKEEYDNMNFIPSDGGLYSAEQAIQILENGNGGSVSDERGRGYLVSYNAGENAWVKNQLLK